MKEDRNELRKLLEDALDSLNDKTELVERISDIEDKLEQLDKKLEKILQKIDMPVKPNLDEFLERIKTETDKIKVGNPPYSKPYTATLNPLCSVGMGPCEYPSDWACILPANCKKCGKQAFDMRAWSGGTAGGVQGDYQSYNAEPSGLYLDDVCARPHSNFTHVKSLDLSMTTVDESNLRSLIPSHVVKSSTHVGKGLDKLVSKPRNKNNAYWKF